MSPGRRQKLGGGESVSQSSLKYQPFFIPRAGYLRVWLLPCAGNLSRSRLRSDANIKLANELYYSFDLKH